MKKDTTQAIAKVTKSTILSPRITEKASPTVKCKRLHFCGRKVSYKANYHL